MMAHLAFGNPEGHKTQNETVPFELPTMLIEQSKKQKAPNKEHLQHK